MFSKCGRKYYEGFCIEIVKAVPEIMNSSQTEVVVVGGATRDAERGNTQCSLQVEVTIRPSGHPKAALAFAGVVSVFSEDQSKNRVSQLIK